MAKSVTDEATGEYPQDEPKDYSDKSQLQWKLGGLVDLRIGKLELKSYQHVIVKRSTEKLPMPGGKTNVRNNPNDMA